MHLIMPEGGVKKLTGQELDIFKRAFEIAQVVLGIAKYEDGIQVCFNKRQVTPTGIIAASTHNTMRNPYRVLIGDAGPVLAEELSSLIHELIHIRQMAEGRLMADEEKETVVFEGKLYTNDVLNLMNFTNHEPHGFQLPWEVEPHAITTDIFGDVLRQLPEGDIAYIVSQVKIAMSERRKSALREAKDSMMGLLGGGDGDIDFGIEGLGGKVLGRGAIKVNRKTGEVEAVGGEDLPDEVKDVIQKIMGALGDIGGKKKKGLN